MAGSLEDLTCKDCRTRWTNPDGWGWKFAFEGNPDPTQNKLLWVQCRACQSEPDRLAISVASDIYWLPETSAPR